MRQFYLILSIVCCAIAAAQTASAVETVNINTPKDTCTGSSQPCAGFTCDSPPTCSPHGSNYCICT